MAFNSVRPARARTMHGLLKPIFLGIRDPWLAFTLVNSLVYVAAAQPFRAESDIEKNVGGCRLVVEEENPNRTPSRHEMLRHHGPQCTPF
jgi:hypothetical protein